MTGHGTSTTGETPRFSNSPNVGAGTGTATSTGLGDSSRVGDSARPLVNSGAYDGNSEASIKSGVIGFTPGQAGQGHAALPNNSTVEDKLDRNQVVGQGGTGLRNEVSTNEQPSVIPGR